MHIRNETWHIEADEAKQNVKLFFKGEDLPEFEVTFTEFCALGALIHQAKEVTK